MVQIFTIAFVLLTVLLQARVGAYGPQPQYGYAAGLVPNCPGVLKNVSISNEIMQKLQISIHSLSSNGEILQKKVHLETAPKMVAEYDSIELKNKKTVLYAVGFLDSSSLAHSRAIANAYSKRGYNVLVLDAAEVLKNSFPKSVRLIGPVGKKVGEFIVKLTEFGLQPENIEMTGVGLGAHLAAHAAKHFYQVTGTKVSRLTGLDPSGPCFRALGTEHKLFRTDAEKVDVIHTNIDGLGIAETLGHVDIYVNGGEFQPSDIPYFPCLILCSHVRVLIYWWQALEHPKKFIAVECNTVQEARFAQCFNNTQTNYLGLEAKFDRPGIYYLATNNEFPYYKGKDGLKRGIEIYSKFAESINSDDTFIV